MAAVEEFWRIDPAGSDPSAQWQQMLSATHLPWTTTLAPTRPGQVFDAWIRRWWIDDLALVDCECDPCSGTRQRRQLADTDGEFVVVLITRSGSEIVSQCDAEALLHPGDAVAWDSARPARFVVLEPLSKRSLLVPRAALDEVGGRAWVHAGVTLDGSAPATRLLTAYLDALSTALPRLSPAAVSAARNATLELFMGAVRAEGDVPTTATAGPALRAAMDRYIERHLLDHAVSPAAIASAHGVSVRTVNRVFNATGQTVSEVVRVRRLARAREELTEGLHPISAIASRWGFSDSSHFSRTFKAHYGASPRDYRDAARSGAPGIGAPVQGAGAAVHAGAVAGRETGVTPLP
jgi:AraC family transcriptional regulator, positive regulator of tynA and feaB